MAVADQVQVADDDEFRPGAAADVLRQRLDGQRRFALPEPLHHLRQRRDAPGHHQRALPRLPEGAVNGQVGGGGNHHDQHEAEVQRHQQVYFVFQRHPVLSERHVLFSGGTARVPIRPDLNPCADFSTSTLTCQKATKCNDYPR